MVHSKPARTFLALAMMLGVLSFVGIADAVHDEGFALQGDIDHASNADWVDMFTVTDGVATPKAALPAGFLRAGFARDFVTNTDGTFASGADISAYATGSKDTLPINVAGQGDWQCKQANKLGDKFNLLNAYAAALRPTAGDSEGDLIVYFGSEISAPEGNRNAGFWLLQDNDADCNSPGGNTDWTGNHEDGDVFIVSAFTDGGNNSNITVYEWVDGSPLDGNADIGGSLQLRFSTDDPDSALDNARCDSDSIDGSPNFDRACAIDNPETVEVNPPWDAPDKDGGNLGPHQFFEGAVNLSALGLDGCFSTAVANSRSSQTPGSTLHDFARMQFETCGNMTVHKYIDADMSGTNNTGDINTGDDVATYAFTVVRDSDDTTVCTGTTDSNGDLVCSTGTLENLPTGSYTITETQKTGFFNTDPGDGNAATNPDFNTGTTVARTVTVGNGDTAVEFGNTCYVDMTFTVNNVPTGSAGLSVDYSATGVTRAAPLTGTVALTQTGDTATATVNDVFNQTDTVAWSWYFTSDTSKKVVGSAGVVLSSSGFPTCSKSTQTNFPSTTISGFKYKDMDADGVQDADDPGLAGFVFELHSGSTPTAATLLQTSGASTAAGTYSFTNAVPAGTYTVVELSKTGWSQTEPATGGRTFTLSIDSAATYTVAPFGNTPLSNITVTFNPLTSDPPATRATSISCVDNNGASVGSNTDSNSMTTGNVTTGQSSVVCTVTYIDP